MNINFIKEVLMSKAEYWIVAKETSYREGFTTKRGTDHILFIAIPKGIRRGLTHEEITLQDVEKLNNSYVDQNIFINTDYPPFQDFTSFKEIYRGYPVEHDIKNFVIKALELKSDDIYKYKDLIKTE